MRIECYFDAFGTKNFFVDTLYGRSNYKNWAQHLFSPITKSGLPIFQGKRAHLKAWTVSFTIGMRIKEHDHQIIRSYNSVHSFKLLCQHQWPTQQSQTMVILGRTDGRMHSFSERKPLLFCPPRSRQTSFAILTLCHQKLTDLHAFFDRIYARLPEQFFCHHSQGDPNRIRTFRIARRELACPSRQQYCLIPTQAFRSWHLGGSSSSLALMKNQSSQCHLSFFLVMTHNSLINV